MSDLFNLPETLSPMEEWRQRHGVTLYKTMEGYRALSAYNKAHGVTQEAALLAWADKSNVKCWKAEELDRLKNASTPSAEGRGV